jgi:hypothetical protein
MVSVNMWLFALVVLLAWGLVKLVKFMATSSKRDATNVDDSCGENLPSSKKQKKVNSSPDSVYIYYDISSSGTSSTMVTTSTGLEGVGSRMQIDPYCPSWAEPGNVVIDKETNNEWVVTCDYVDNKANDDWSIMLQVEHIEIEGLEREFLLSEVDPAEGDWPL